VPRRLRKPTVAEKLLWAIDELEKELKLIRREAEALIPRRKNTGSLGYVEDPRTGRRLTYRKTECPGCAPCGASPGWARLFRWATPGRPRRSRRRSRGGPGRRDPTGGRSAAGCFQIRSDDFRGPPHCETVSFKVTEAEKARLDRFRAEEGYPSLSPMVRELIRIGLKYYPVEAYEIATAKREALAGSPAVREMLARLR